MHDHRPGLLMGLAAAALAALLPAPPAHAEILRSAGWHGREIREPHPRLAEATRAPSFPRGWSAGAVARGSGYHRPRGSERVRELQRRLARRGYGPGPADGRFGKRTRSAVLWFQIKHGLPRTGRGDAHTITRLRAPARVQATDVTPAPVGATVVPAASSGFDVVAAVWLAIVILLGLAVIAAWVRSTLRRTPPPAAAPVAIEPSPRVLGYAVVDDSRDLDAAARAIGAWCEARDWPLGRVIHDRVPARGRPGLRHALDEIVAGRASGLVVMRLRDLTGSLSELGPLLQWFADADAFVIALDYELDTSGDAGGLAARALVQVSAWERDRVATRNAGRRGAASGAAVRDDPELAARILAMRDSGMSLQAIADALNESGVPTLRGGSRWRPSSVQAATGYKRPPTKLPKPGNG